MSRDIDPLYNSDTYTQALHAAHAHQERNWPLIKTLQTESDRNARRDAFIKLRRGDDDLFELVKTVIESRFEHAIGTGHASITALVTEHERDPIDWEGWLSAGAWREAVSAYALAYANARCAAVGANKLLPWDYWLAAADERPFDSRHVLLAANDRELRSLMDDFLRQIGCAEMAGRLEWAFDDGGMRAEISVNGENRLRTVIHVAEFNIHADAGSLKQLIMAAHEIGHAIQARFTLNPTKTNLVPPHPFREIASMFFEKLFSSPPNLEPATRLDAETCRKIAAALTFEATETMMRLFCHLEWEIILYRLAASDHFNPADVSRAWQELRRRYFGIFPNGNADQSWLIYCFHTVYRPLYVRSYVVGDIISAIMLTQLFHPPCPEWDSAVLHARLTDIMGTCSEKGANTGWQDFATACGISDLGQYELMANAMKRITHAAA